MKLSKLYIKIFLSFVLVLILTAFLIFGLFMVAAKRGFQSRMERALGAHVLIVKNLVEAKIRDNPEIRLAENESLRSIIEQLGEAYGSKVWLAGPNGKPILKSFSGDLSDNIRKTQRRDFLNRKHYDIYRGPPRGWEFYAVIPTMMHGGEMGGLHVLFEKRSPDEHHEGAFALGLLGICLFIALLVIPVSRFITKRVNQLGQSALKIAGGDLSHRATVKGRDEIGELSRAFNLMADKLEIMIKGGRELTANISHELRTPLARIRIAEQLLKEKLERDDYGDWARHLKDIREDIEELDHLIGRILDLSKLDIHESPLIRESLDLSAMIEVLLERFAPTISQKSLNLKKELVQDRHYDGEREMLRTAFSNIIGNAVKYVPEGGELSVKMRAENGDLTINVTNTSDAIPEENLARIFEPFYQAKKTPESGSGLGLAITKKIIEKHGGKIEAHNVSEGLNIEIHLPAFSPKD
jgi:two-component system sensor histidine kinase CpxA